MSKIKILSEHLANQIAAGEVIERPASVVKELLENSIDAGGRRVRIDIEGSGTRLIRVIDDGGGMDGDDALLCLERHATSKLGDSTNDSSRLGAIRTLGFRGEAIPSIGSVSKMTITSRTGKAPLGTRVEVRYGKVLKVHETGCNKGTVMEIRDLFGNVPARKKFLKSSRTELFHIEETIKNYCLANSRLGITYTVNNTTVLDLAPDVDTLEDRVNLFCAKNGSVPLIPIHDPGDSADRKDDIVIDGFLLSPEHSFAASAKLRLFVNGRAVKDRMMMHAVSEGLSGYLLKGRSAAGVLFVSLPHEAVDVNVHPAKQEIRFQQSNVIHQKIVSAVQSAMKNFQHQAKLSIFGNDRHLTAGIKGQAARSESRGAGPAQMDPLWSRPRDFPIKDSSGSDDYHAFEGDRTLSGSQHNETAITAEPETPFLQTGLPQGMVPDALEVIGQFKDLYLLCEAHRGEESFLVVIDQHAVHERILFENLKEKFAARQMASQELLFPRMVELTPESAETLEKHREAVRDLGIIVEEFGGDNYVIKAVPSVIGHLDPEEILTGILGQFSGPASNDCRRRKDATRLDDILSTMACKAAIKAGQSLKPLEMDELLKLMKESSAFTHCPHGRPVVHMFSATEVKKWFRRT